MVAPTTLYIASVRPIRSYSTPYLVVTTCWFVYSNPKPAETLEIIISYLSSKVHSTTLALYYGLKWISERLEAGKAKPT